MTAYLRDLLAEERINLAEFEALSATGAQSADELFAISAHFPGLVARALPGGNLARISAMAAQRTSQAFQNAVLSQARHPISFAMGAAQPSGARVPLGSQVGIGAANQGAGMVLPKIDHHTSLRTAGWPVRNQGDRGTCVAHAMAACKEASTGGGSAPADVSEQFLFWGAKQHDPNKNDGTLHCYALAGMQGQGVSPETEWPYVGLVRGTADQGPPPIGAVQAGRASLHLGGQVQQNAKAADLYQQLKQSPVAIGVPVFSDPNNTRLDNWNVAGLLDFGRVVDPQPYSIASGGHAVCIVGFEPDPNESSGTGWFIFRNSWGVGTFGSKLPHPRYHAPEAGYGQISWAYVDNYLWEMCSL